MRLGHKELVRSTNTREDYNVRPFETIQDHDNAVFNAINQHVLPDHDLYILGDLYFDEKYKNTYKRRINCKNIHIIWGNNDKPEENYRRLDIPGIPPIILFHYPIESWDGCGKGSYHLHAYTHAKMPPRGRRLETSVDSSLFLFDEIRPFSAHDVHEILKEVPPSWNLE